MDDILPPNRRTFLRYALGMVGGALVLGSTGLTTAGCEKTSVKSPTGPDQTDGLTISGNTLTIDTTVSAWAVLSTAGGYADVNALGQQLVIFRLGASSASALSRICTHQGCDITSQSSGVISGDRIVCPCHGSAFLIANGDVVQGPAPTGVRGYPTIVSGSNILVTVA